MKKYLSLIFTLSLALFFSVQIISAQTGPSCTDGILNQNEVTIDAGGICGGALPNTGTCTDGILNPNTNEGPADQGGRCAGGVLSPGNSFLPVIEHVPGDTRPIAINWQSDGTIPASWAPYLEQTVKDWNLVDSLKISLGGPGHTVPMTYKEFPENWIGAASYWVVGGGHQQNPRVSYNKRMMDQLNLNNSNYWQFVICHEQGHTLGAGHVNENNGPNPDNLGSCMDYSRKPEGGGDYGPMNNLHPSSTDIATLKRLYYHGHHGSVGGSGGGGGGGGGASGGGVGGGEHITPPGTQITGEPMCIPKAEFAGKAFSMVATSDNRFSAMWGVKDAAGNETLQAPFIADMDWYSDTPTSINDTTGWKSSESKSGTVPENVSALYYGESNDRWVTHGSLYTITINGKNYDSGSNYFEVMKSSVPGSDNPNPFNLVEFLNQIKTGTWHMPKMIGENGISPWGTIPGAFNSAKWVYEGNDWNPSGGLEGSSYAIYRLKVCDAPTTSMCIDFQQGLGINYTVTFPTPITVTGNNSDIRVKIVKANGDVIYGNYTGPSADGKGLHFMIAPGTPFTLSAGDFVGTVTLLLTNGATVKTNAGVSVDLNIGALTAANTCTPAVYQGLSTADSILSKTVTEVASTGGYGGGPKKKLEIKVKFVNSGTGDPNAYVFGTPVLYLQRDETTDLGAGAVYVSGSGTDTLTFEHISNAQNYPDSKYDFTTYNHLKMDTTAGSIHTRANNGTSYWFSNLNYFNTH